MVVLNLTVETRLPQNHSDPPASDSCWDERHMPPLPGPHSNLIIYFVCWDFYCWVCIYFNNICMYNKNHLHIKCNYFILNSTEHIMLTFDPCLLFNKVKLDSRFICLGYSNVWFDFLKSCQSMSMFNQNNSSNIDFIASHLICCIVNHPKLSYYCSSPKKCYRS